MTVTFASVAGRAGRIVMVGALLAVLAGCNVFGPAKITEEAIIPPETLYQSALDDMDKLRYQTAAQTLEKLERQHPYSEYSEKAKLMQVFAYYRIGKFEEAILAADRYIALYPASKEIPYILYLKGNAYYAQIRDITRDQQLSQNAIDNYQLIVSGYPQSEYARDAREKMTLASDQLAGKEMSVGRYYLGNGQHTAAINRFRVVVEEYQTSSHIEEALYRLTEAYLQLGLTSEATTAAAVLGHNYPASQWYKSAVTLLQNQGLAPKLVDGNWLATAQG